MHQQPRAQPKVSSSPASSPQTNTSRTNNPREGRRPSADSEVSGSGKGKERFASPATEDASPAVGASAEAVRKLDQIVQNFYIKAANLVLYSRTKLKPAVNKDGLTRTNKWFQIETDEIEDFRDEFKIWKSSSAINIDNRPPPMIIEVYLDTSRLKENQTLVLLDDEGKRWDVMEQLNSSASSAGYGDPNMSDKNSEVILERWRVELKSSRTTAPEDFGPILPTIYKKAIVFFRSLFVTTRLLPCWKFASQGPAKNGHPALLPRCRIRASEPERSDLDLLRHPIDGRPDPVTEYVFGDLEAPVGRLACSVTYRNDCSFRVDDSEALLSSRFMGVDENFFKPSMQRASLQRDQAAEVGSLRERAQRTNAKDIHQTYGSLSTFHGDGPLGTSPLSALKAVKPPDYDTDSPPGSLPTNMETAPPGSLPVSNRPASARPPLRSSGSSSRRPSISFQPFKAGSLSGSPRPDSESPASPHSLNRPPSLHQPRNRTSLTAGMPSSLRGGPAPAPAPDAAAPGTSPRQASTSRYSSSFTHRRARSSFGGTSRAGDDEQLSSGRQSLASSVAQPGSGLLTEAEAGSSGSFQGDDDNITEFLKMLDSKKSLKSFDSNRKGESAANRTVAQLSKFHMMKESNNVLTESMTSSMQIQPSSSTSSRQLTSVPGMAAPASLSPSSSPGKPMSPHTPHTPHTPAIPSRLSESSIADNTSTHRRSSRTGRAPEPTVPEASRGNTITPDVPNAIDIPLSPRYDSYQQQRSSSVAQRSRASATEAEDADLAFAHRSISLGADDREPPSLSALLGRQMEMEEKREEEHGRLQQSSRSGLQPAAEIQGSATSESMQGGSTEENPPEAFMSTVPSSSSSPFGRRRYTGMAAAAAGRRQTPPQSSRGSFAGSTSRLGRGGDDESLNEEPLMFDLSEMDAQGRRSLEEGRGGGSVGSDARGAARRGW